MKKCSSIDIDAVLPQTQCGLCGYGGCMPYAKAMSDENAPINLCPPGGVDTLKTLAMLLNQDASPYIDEMRKREKPAMLAVIREAECIGCTKCIAACPVDAIIGGAKNMHVVLTDLCTGCELCIPPCPVDCIEMITITEPLESDRALKRNLARSRFNRREVRLQKIIANETRQQVQDETTEKKVALQSYITAALNRSKKNKDS